MDMTSVYVLCLINCILTDSMTTNVLLKQVTLNSGADAPSWLQCFKRYWSSM